MKVKLEHRFSFYPDQGIDQLARVSLFQFYCIQHLILQCFDAVGWAAGRASGL